MGRPLKVLVTGASGYLGQFLLDALLLSSRASDFIVAGTYSTLADGIADGNLFAQQKYQNLGSDFVLRRCTKDTARSQEQGLHFSSTQPVSTRCCGQSCRNVISRSEFSFPFWGPFAQSIFAKDDLLNYICSYCGLRSVKRNGRRRQKSTAQNSLLSRCGRSVCTACFLNGSKPARPSPPS